jgi:hypothetical protein
LDVEGVGQFLPYSVEDLHEALAVSVVLLLDLRDFVLDILLEVVP